MERTVHRNARWLETGTHSSKGRQKKWLISVWPGTPVFLKRTAPVDLGFDVSSLVIIQSPLQPSFCRLFLRRTATASDTPSIRVSAALPLTAQAAARTVAAHAHFRASNSRPIMCRL
jgi:hypothetical protein